MYAHGKTCNNLDKIGVVTRYDFMRAMITSVKTVYEEVVMRFRELPIYLFAHSMGSMVAQRYIEIHPDDYEKVILSGTDYPGIKYSFAKSFSKMFLKKNDVSYSKLIDNMGAGGFNKKFKEEHPQTSQRNR